MILELQGQMKQLCTTGDLRLLFPDENAEKNWETVQAIVCLTLARNQGNGMAHDLLSEARSLLPSSKERILLLFTFPPSMVHMFKGERLYWHPVVSVTRGRNVECTKGQGTRSVI